MIYTGRLGFRLFLLIHNISNSYTFSYFILLQIVYQYIIPKQNTLNTHTQIMQNENGENVDLYIPRKCSWTNRLIEAKDHGSVQINVANVDPVTGLYTGETASYALSGYIRDKSEGDMALTALVEANDKKDAEE